MAERENSATLRQPSGPRNPPRTEHWVSWLLVAAASVYGVEAVLLIATPVPAWVVWGLMGAVCGLVILACVLGTGRAAHGKVEPTIARWQDRRHARDAWVQLWEELAQRPVR